MDSNTSRLIQIYRKAEEQIKKEIARLRDKGLVDYHAVAALLRVRKILQKLTETSKRLIPSLIEHLFYVANPDKAKTPKTPQEHLEAYNSSEALSSDEMDMVQRLSLAAVDDLSEAANVAEQTITDMVIGRRENDIFRKVGLEVVTSQAAAGTPMYKAEKEMIDKLQAEGVTCFVDKAGHKWSLSNYANMVLRTTEQQAANAAFLAKYKDDLVKMSSHGTTCRLCASYEGRVFSVSGTSPYYPPLADAFGKVDKAGPNTLANTYLCIHPNCLHSFEPWSEYGLSEDELDAIRKKSNPKTNPYSVDPRTKEQIDAYRKKQKARAKLLRDMKQYKAMSAAGIPKFPKTFQTFQKHKRADDEKYHQWLEEYNKLK